MFFVKALVSFLACFHRKVDTSLRKYSFKNISLENTLVILLKWIPFILTTKFSFMLTHFAANIFLITFFPKYHFCINTFFPIFSAIRNVRSEIQLQDISSIFLAQYFLDYRSFLFQKRESRETRLINTQFNMLIFVSWKLFRIANHVLNHCE